MAPIHTGSMWFLMVGTCLQLVLGLDCRKECAMCLYQMLEEQSTFSPLACSFECHGLMDIQKLRLCQDLVLPEENPLDENLQQLPEEGGGSSAADVTEEASPEYQLAKKYGGFMKRYAGFTSQLSSSSLRGEREDTGKPGKEEENIRLDILKILNSAAEKGGEGRNEGGNVEKRYGGFMRRAGEEVQGDLLEAVLGRGLKKRYGGFMRRVGRPEWLVDHSKNVDGMVLKRSRENGNKLLKRYGGFMD